MCMLFVIYFSTTYSEGNSDLHFFFPSGVLPSTGLRRPRFLELYTFITSVVRERGREGEMFI